MIKMTGYQATYRQSERALPVLLGIVAVMVGGIVVIINYADGRNLQTMIFSLIGFAVFSMLIVLLTTFWFHRWTLQPDGIQIHERPKVPLMGLSRRAVIPFPAIAALRRVESGFDYIIEIVTRDGRRYRMPQAMIPATSVREMGVPTPMQIWMTLRPRSVPRPSTQAVNFQPHRKASASGIRSSAWRLS
jgi:hypothetical protein